MQKSAQNDIFYFLKHLSKRSGDIKTFGVMNWYVLVRLDDSVELRKEQRGAHTTRLSLSFDEPSKNYSVNLN